MKLNKLFEEICNRNNLTYVGINMLKSLYLQIFINEVWENEEEALLRAEQRLIGGLKNDTQN